MKKQPNLKGIALLSAALLMSGSGSLPLKLAIPKARDPKNKFNLTPKEIEHLKSLSPKEKKLFLRGRK